MHRQEPAAGGAEPELGRAGPVTVVPLPDRPEAYALLARWRNEPHVRQFWDPDLPPLTPQVAESEYRPCSAGRSATHGCLILLGGQPVGYVQHYAWLAYAEEARALGIEPEGSFGLDLFVGEPGALGQGVGSRAVRVVVDYLFRVQGAERVSLLTSVENPRAQRAYEKAGFRKLRRALDLDQRGGQRIESWLMSVERPPKFG